ncbi:uncharacterized protein N7446_012453 [Penicillium canescens]|uniref:uncharacterized protein n=1 Tax=Penicillium canescens TaxID=5083 RepID=UPI0026DF90AF|nr:uncharacterized protein N7446_012453 [Penicillium canescens]KAJ6045589.1 hypothetical protein N7446_012453 [Penicillium canescens]KAJ6059928.1 hypothetical protein N7444_002860 [Penicillium canescens]
MRPIYFVPLGLLALPGWCRLVSDLHSGTVDVVPIPPNSLAPKGVVPGSSTMVHHLPGSSDANKHILLPRGSKKLIIPGSGIKSWPIGPMMIQIIVSSATDIAFKFINGEDDEYRFTVFDVLGNAINAIDIDGGSWGKIPNTRKMFEAGKEYTVRWFEA